RRAPVARRHPCPGSGSGGRPVDLVLHRGRPRQGDRLASDDVGGRPDGRRDDRLRRGPPDRPAQLRPPVGGGRRLGPGAPFRWHDDRMTAADTLHWSNADVEVHKVVVGPVDNNVFVVRCRATGESVMIDAANEHELLLDLCQRLDVRRVLETHGHWDHIGAVTQVREAGYEVGVTLADAPMLSEVGYDVLLDDAEVIEVGRLRLHAIHNPGHTPGSISCKVRDRPLLFTGDTLFPGGPGNTSSPTGDFPAIIESIDRKLLRFPANTVVLPGRGVDTTIGTERPHLDEWIAR